jgi:hypothetical protein
MLLWDVHCLERRRIEIGKGSRAKRLGGELGAPAVSFIGLARQIVASSRGSGSWRISQEKSEGGKASLTSPPMGRLEF